MPDWKELVQKRIASLRLDAPGEANLAEELAQHLEDHYRELLSGGATEEEAYQTTIAELNDIYPLGAALDKSQRMATHDAALAGDGKRGNFIEDLWRDLRYALR